MAKVDTEPKTIEDLGARRAILRRQITQVSYKPVDGVTCPCGITTPLDKAYKCFYCGLWFCQKCSERHFSDPSIMTKERAELFFGWYIGWDKGKLSRILTRVMGWKLRDNGNAFIYHNPLNTEQMSDLLTRIDPDCHAAADLVRFDK